MHSCLMTIVIGPSLLLSGCAMRLIGIPLPISLAPVSVTLTTDAPIVSVEHSLVAGVVPAVGGDAPALGGDVPALAGSVPALDGSSPILGGDTPAIGGSSPALEGTLGLDGTDEYPIVAGVTANYPASSAQRECAVLAPFDTALSCSNFQMAFDNVDLTTSGGLQVKAYDGTEGPLQATLSNSVPVRRYRITEVADTSNNPAGTDTPVSIVELNGELYFTARNPDTVSKLYKVSAAGAVTQVSNTTNDQEIGDAVSAMTVFNGELYFRANNRNEITKLFKVNTAGNVVQVSNTSDSHVQDDYPQYMTEYRGELYFSALNASDQAKLFKLDTAGAITQISNTANNQGLGDGVTSLTVFDDHLYFGAFNRNAKAKIFKADSSGTVTQVSNTSGNQNTDDMGSLVINIGHPFGTPHLFVNFSALGEVGERMYFNAYNPNGNFLKLFAVSKTGVITQVSNTRGDQSIADSVSNFSVNPAGTHAYFGAYNSNGNFSKLFKLDSAGSITPVADIKNNASVADSYTGRAHFNGAYYFGAANQNGLFRKLFKIDADENVTQVSNLRGNQSAGDLVTTVSLVEFDDALFFVGNNAASNVRKLYRMGSDGEIVQVSNSSGASNAHDLALNAVFTTAGDSLYFAGYNPSGGYKLFRLSRVESP